MLYMSLTPYYTTQAFMFMLLSNKIPIKLREVYIERTKIF